MHIRFLQTADVPSCAALAHAACLAEQQAHGSLPAANAALFQPLLSNLFSQGTAFATEEDGFIVGYLAFSPPFEGAFGNCSGVFSPLHGCACAGHDPSRTLSHLLTAAMEHLYRQGITSIALSRYAHEEALLRTLVMTGFGIRCTDLMARTSPEMPPHDGLQLRTMRKKDIPHVLSLLNDLEAHMASAPVFMPKSAWTEQQVEQLGEKVLLACADDLPIAVTLLGHSGETYLDELPHVTHLGSTYCREDFRGKGVMDALVQYASALAHERGFTHIGVDCETLNPPAFRFWQKHFTPFTYSAVRRLDERLLP